MTMTKIFDKYKRTLLSVATLCGAASLSFAQIPGEALSSDAELLNIYDVAVFYDGYKTDEVVDASKDDGIVRFTNYHYAKKLNVNEIVNLGSDLQLEVLIGAMCDNYDRMGRVMLAFPPSGQDTYEPEAVERIEIARFITPFMNKNYLPRRVPYVYDIEDVRQLLSDSETLQGKDVWMEVEIFGIPYSAQAQIRGCAGHNDVFNATVSFGAKKSQESSIQSSKGNVVLVPVATSKCEIFGNVNLNNYRAEATDTIGTTTRTYKFSLSDRVADSQLTLINSNHGAGEDGEEYVRRKHLIYVDGELAMVYTPGGEDCEPYRRYNTQGNFIYGSEPDYDFWFNWSNWCPGQAVPIRRLSTGALEAGEHTVMIRVPDAEFAGADGDFRPSLWLMGVKEGKIAQPSGVEKVIEPSIGLAVTGDILHLDGEVKRLSIYSYDGRLLEGKYNPGAEYSIASLSPGQYVVIVESAAGEMNYLKIVR